jgi:cytochrome P450 / NADPH-cytochrome P450 reductase
MSTPIPQPPGVPFLGNINNLDRELPLRAHIQLQKQYGEIYQLTIFGASLLAVFCMSSGKAEL